MSEPAIPKSVVEVACGAVRSQLRGKRWISDAQLWELLSAVLTATQAEYGRLGYRLVCDDGATVERMHLAGERWSAEHPNGAFSDDEWRCFHRAVLTAALGGER